MPNDLRHHWNLPSDVSYLNHGSFGPTPNVVQQVREEWSRKLARQPMNFFLREMETALDAAAERLGEFIGANANDLAFVDNATTAMNCVARSFPLQTGDEVLLNDHEYGAVLRIWNDAVKRTGAKVVSATIPTPIHSASDVVDALFASVTERTRMIVVSHVTSPTAIIFPVAEIVAKAHQQGIAVCIDGPHAVAMLPINLKAIDADFYCASCHKWLSAPLGSGFLHVKRRWQSTLQPHAVSWGRSVGGNSARWQDSLNWIGTRDPAPFLAIPSAIDFLKEQGLETFRDGGHRLARNARIAWCSQFQTAAYIPDSPAWYGTMITVPLPESDIHAERPNEADPWQKWLWHVHRTEIPIVTWRGKRHIRISGHLYNSDAEVTQLSSRLRELSTLTAVEISAQIRDHQEQRKS